MKPTVADLLDTCRTYSDDGLMNCVNLIQCIYIYMRQMLKFTSMTKFKRVHPARPRYWGQTNRFYSSASALQESIQKLIQTYAYLALIWYQGKKY